MEWDFKHIIHHIERVATNCCDQRQASQGGMANTGCYIPWEKWENISPPLSVLPLNGSCHWQIPLRAVSLRGRDQMQESTGDWQRLKNILRMKTLPLQLSKFPDICYNLFQEECLSYWYECLRPWNSQLPWRDITQAIKILFSDFMLVRSKLSDSSHVNIYFFNRWKEQLFMVTREDLKNTQADKVKYTNKIRWKKSSLSRWRFLHLPPQDSVWVQSCFHVDRCVLETKSKVGPFNIFFPSQWHQLSSKNRNNPHPDNFLFLHCALKHKNLHILLWKAT